MVCITKPQVIQQYRITKDKIVYNYRYVTEKVNSFTRFSLRFKLILLLPMLAWLALFQFCKFVPYDKRPTIDVTTLPTVEGFVLFGGSLQHFPRNLIPDTEQWKDLLAFMDMMAAFAYLVHFVVTWIFAIFLYVYYRKKSSGPGQPVIQPWTFLFCFGFLNLLAVATQLAWPTAPPWYVELYGNKPASYSMEGHPAGLDKADHILQYPLFRNLYGNSPIVFGSFPSLHAAWPIMITIFAPAAIKPLKIVGVVYVLVVWWAAVYLNHHFVLDLVGGAIYVAIAYYIGTYGIKLLKNLMKDKILSNGSKFEKVSGAELDDIDIYSPDDYSKKRRIISSKTHSHTHKEEIRVPLLLQEV